MQNTKLTLAYWPVQGVAHPIRLLLSHFKIPFEEKLYKDGDDWFNKDKPTLKTPMPNLPYIQDSDLILTESLACIQYAALKTGQKDLLGKNDLDSIRIFQLWGLCKDLIRAMALLVWNPDFDKEKETVLTEKVTPILTKLGKGLGEEDYPMGYLTWVDFNLAHLLDVVKRLWPEALDKHPNLEKYRQRIYSSEGIQAYRKSENYPKTFTLPTATWPAEEKV